MKIQTEISRIMKKSVVVFFNTFVVGAMIITKIFWRVWQNKNERKRSLDTIRSLIIVHFLGIVRLNRRLIQKHAKLKA